MRHSHILLIVALWLALCGPVSAQQAPRVIGVATGPLTDGRVLLTLDLNRQPPEGVGVTAGTVLSSAATATVWRVVVDLDACHGQAQIGGYVYARSCVWLPVGVRQ